MVFVLVPPGVKSRIRVGEVDAKPVVRLLANPGDFQFRGLCSGCLVETSGVVVRPSSGNEFPKEGAPLRGVLAFFLLGTREVIRTLGVVTIGSGLLVGVVVWSVTQMAVRDRLATIRVARATGAQSRTILAVVTGRATMLTGAGVLAGYAMGIIAVNSAVNLAVFLGLPVSIDVALDGGTAVTIALLCLGVGAVGPLAGLLAGLPTVRRDPAELTESARRAGVDTAFRGNVSRLARVRNALRPKLLSWWAVIPTTATLTSFVVFLVLIGAMAGVVSPMASSSGVTITEPGATHPIASTVPETHVRALEQRGIPASGEILLFEVLDGQPYVARGVNFSDFVSVTAVRIVRGRPPEAMDEAVIGEDLARTLGVEVGDRVPVGGSTNPGFDTVNVVGIFDAPAHFDDELLVSLPLARELNQDSPGSVQFIRADRLPEGVTEQSQGVYVAAIRAPDQVASGQEFTVRITLHNLASESAPQSLRIALGDEVRTRRISLGPDEQRTLEIAFTAPEPGAYSLRVNDETRPVRVVAGNALTLPYLPEEAPVGSSPLLVVRTPLGEPVANATITVGAREVRTDERGRARVHLTDAGTVTIQVRKGDRTLTRTISVQDGVEKRALASLEVRPKTPSLQASPRAILTLFNPWNRTLTVRVQVGGPGVDATQTVHVDPGQTRTLQFDLARRPPGEYTVTARFEEGENAREDTVTYRVTGDDRIAAALARGAHAGKSGIGRAAETAFGNLRLVLAVVLLLAGAMSVGGTTAAFAQAVYARRRTIGIHRATGASPRDILTLVLVDALRIGVVAGGLAIAFASAGLFLVERLGLLTVFGVRLSPTLSPTLAGGILSGVLVVTLLGAGLATLGLLAASPWTVLVGNTSSPPASTPARPRESRGPTESRGDDS